MEFPLNSSQGGPDLAGTRLNTVPKRYYGKYRGTVINVEDPMRMGRAMRLATEAGRLAYLSGRIPKKLYATASSPLEGTIASRVG